MRATVGHLSRNIKIRGNIEDDWGGTLLVYHWIFENATDSISARGSVFLDGVEFFNMGKRNSDNAGVRVYYTNTDGD